MADFKELVAKLKENHIDVMLDMVFNHCSTKHEWFQKALAGDEKYRKYFYLRPAQPDGSLPTNWQSKFGGPAWEKFGDTDLYYLHLYDKSQVDLDWHNPNVRKEAACVVNFWRKKGVKGFRFDVINVIGKSENLADSVDLIQEKAQYTDTPIVHNYLKELSKNSFGQDPAIITVGEMSSATVENCIQYSRPEDHELSMVFTFHHLKVDYKNGEKWSKTPFDFMKLKSLFIEWQTKMDKNGGWSALFWNNHDQPWALNRFGDPVNYREKSAELLATALHLMRGTPYIYMGEEIGMTNPHYLSINDYVDIESRNAYQELLKKGFSAHNAFELIQAKSRDNSRVPMHWDSSKNAGFSHVKPWLHPTNQKMINVKDELDHGEIFSYYQKLISLRKSEELVSDGHFKALLENDQQVFAYERFNVKKGKKKQMLVFNNFYGKKAKIQVPQEYQGKSVLTLISNYDVCLKKIEKTLELRPYEALAVKLLN